MMPLYGEHQLCKEKNKIVCVVESEKTAIIASWFYPNFDFVACGAANGLTSEKLSILFGRKIYWLATNFDSITPDYLTANLAGLFKLRVGNYRVVYSFSRELRIITIHIIGHRSEIYR